MNYVMHFIRILPLNNDFRSLFQPKYIGTIMENYRLQMEINGLAEIGVA